MCNLHKILHKKLHKIGAERGPKVMTTAPNPKLKVPCPACRQPTNHEVLFEHATDEGSEEHDIQAGRDHQVIRCLGCERVSFREASWCSESLDPETGKPETYETLFPSRVEIRVPVDAERYLPADVARMYGETIQVFNAGARVLTAAGIRATVEAVCIERGCTGRNLKERIDALVSSGAVSTTQEQVLTAHRFMGNDAVHDMLAPDEDELPKALDALEAVLASVYQLPAVADELNHRRARRKK